MDLLRCTDLDVENLVSEPSGSAPLDFDWAMLATYASELSVIFLVHLSERLEREGYRHVRGDAVCSCQVHLAAVGADDLFRCGNRQQKRRIGPLFFLCRDAFDSARYTPRHYEQADRFETHCTK